jgi:hypothetical protein
LRHTGKRLAALMEERREVADDRDLGMSRGGQVRIHEDPAGAGDGNESLRPYSYWMTSGNDAVDQVSREMTRRRPARSASSAF